MSDNIALYIGNQIRFYRKSAKLSVEELAKRINKSKATVSKYENGSISIDIETLNNVAQALNIDILNLIDYKRGNAKYNKIASNSFEECETLYLYHYYKKEYHSSILHIRKEESSEKIYATMYYKVSDIENPSTCSCIYNGYMSSYDHIINFVLQNYYSHSEEILINSFIPANNTQIVLGMMIGIQDKTLKPASFKVAISKKPLSIEEKQELLPISKDVIKRLEEDGALIIE